ncbi:MAG: LysR family transcriptional regulator [Kordiimonadaceae bacterium]|nr:LysR family transcriptional regulator [Kordiimonadaceae bacterium]
MKHRLQSLSGLLGFDAVARHESLTLAAKELGRTQSAVSQQVKLLEEQTGLTLLTRRPRQIALTAAGKTLAKTVSDVLGTLDRTLDSLTAQSEPNVLRVGVYQSFAIHWLIPRLPRFSLKHPEIDVRVNADDTVQDPLAVGYDLNIRSGATPPEGRRSYKDMWAPVYAPSLCKEGDITGATISQYILLGHGSANFWDQWLTQNRVEKTSIQYGTNYSHSVMLVQAAAAGGGIAMAPLLMAADSLKSGRLRLVAGKAVVGNHCSYLVTAQNSLSEKVRVFADWIDEEMVQMNDDLKKYLL